MKIINNKNFYIYLLIYLVGIFHWIFFFYFVDYYGYNNENIYDEIKIINEKQDLVAVSVNKIGNLYLDRDKAFLKSFIEKPTESGSWINGGFFVLKPSVFDYLVG